jgi:hypothetical protein
VDAFARRHTERRCLAHVQLECVWREFPVRGDDIDAGMSECRRSPHDGEPAITAATARVGIADNLAFVVHPIDGARNIPGKGSEIRYRSIAPEDRVRRGVARKIGRTVNLSAIVDRYRDIIHCTAERRKADRRPIFPKQRVNGIRRLNLCAKRPIHPRPSLGRSLRPLRRSDRPRTASQLLAPFSRALGFK